MGAEENKQEEKKVEEEVKKTEEEEAKKPEGEEEKKTEEPQEAKEPLPPQDIVLKVFMHCEGCARKVRRCLKGFPGVEDVETNCKTHIVTVKGEKADPLKVLERVQRKSHRQVELLSPIPKPPVEEEKKSEEDNKENTKPEEEKKKEQEVIITVVLKVHMHCEACAQEIQKRILRMKGVKTTDADLKSSQVTVKGIFDPPKLVEYVYKRTGKHAMIVKTEPEKKEEEEKPKEENTEKKEEGEKVEEEKKKQEEDEAKPAEGEGKKQEEAEQVKEPTVVEVEMKKNELLYYPPKYHMEYAYPPQIFSDENPNACNVM